MTPVSRERGWVNRRPARKSSAFLRFVRGPSLAIHLGVMVCALAGSSCLMPQSVDPIVEVPHPPPHFVLESIPDYLLVPRLELYRQGSFDAAQVPPCHCKLELFIPFVEEDDPTVTLEARWFVDYDPLVPRLAAVVDSEKLTGDFNSPFTLRTMQKRFTFDADQLQITTNGTHTVDVMIADTTAYDDNSTTRPRRTLKPGYTADEYRFFVNVKYDQDPAQPQCPQSKLSLRVCQ